MTVSDSFKKTGLGWMAVLIIIMTILSFDIHYAYWKEYKKIICWDVLSYYAYLPSVYIYDDISLSFIDENPVLYGDKFWPCGTPTGKYAIKTTMGLAFLYAPFFWVAHPVAQMLGYEANGYSLPYKVALSLSALFCLAVGLLFLKKVLERYFSDTVVAFTLISVTLGTNLLHYSTAEAAMPHSYNFSLFSVWMYLCMKWHERPGLKNSIGLGLLSGLIALIRPTNALIVILLILWGVKDPKSLKERLVLFFRSYPLVIALMISFIVVWIPQMLYWKYISGSYWFYSYGNERFFFGHPHIVEGLLGFRKGWLIYTPMMVLALFGIGMMYKNLKELFYPMLVFTLLNIYVVLSWWAWWYGGGFGLRAFIDSYSVLAIPLAVFFTRALNGKRAVKIAAVSVVLIFLALNIFQTRQYQRTVIHWDAMTARAYRAVFLKMERPENLNELIESPDYAKAVQGMEE